MYKNLSEVLSACLIFVLISVFNLLSILYTYRLKQNIGNLPLFERSEHLLILALVFNYFGSLLNLLEGIIYYIVNENDLGFQYFFYFSATFCTRFYACCMGLRMYRIKELHSVRSICHPCPGKFLMENSWYLLTILIFYSSIFTGLYFLIYYTYSQAFAGEKFIQMIYLLESLFCMAFSFRYFGYASHPSISVEYSFYAIIWISGISENGEYRCFYEIPLRNLLLVFISVLSLYYHSAVMRPPLPSDIYFKNIFEIQELYYNFIEFIEKYEKKEVIDACKLYKDLEIIGEYNVQAVKSLLMLSINRNISEYLSQFESVSDDSQIKESLEDILSIPYRNYLVSEELESFKKEYFINFN